MLLKLYKLKVLMYNKLSVLHNKFGETWPAEYANTVLLPEQRTKWNEGLRSGSTAIGLLDYPHFKYFAIKFKNNHDILRLRT